MANTRKLYERAKCSRNNWQFSDFVRLIEGVGYVHARTKGDHRFYTHPCAPGLLNIQPRHGEAKPSQIREVVKRIEEYGLLMEGE